jgi:hypothetical protein
MSNSKKYEYSRFQETDNIQISITTIESMDHQDPDLISTGTTRQNENRTPLFDH